MKAFYHIKIAINKSPSLYSPDFSKDFILYTFTSNLSLATVIVQKYGNNDERPISFVSTGLQGIELNYLDIYKQAYVV